MVNAGLHNSLLRFQKYGNRFALAADPRMSRLVHGTSDLAQKRLDQLMQILEVLVERRTAERGVSHEFADREIAKRMFPEKSDGAVHDLSARLFRGMTA